METIYERATGTAKRIRAILKAKFPEVAFSVRSKSYSGGSSVRVNWTDGPFREDVEKAVEWLEGATFDGMQDLKSSTPPVFSNPDGSMVKIHGADYIHCDRDLSNAKMALLEQAVRVLFADGEKILNTCEKWRHLNMAEKMIREELQKAEGGK